MSHVADVRRWQKRNPEKTKKWKDEGRRRARQRMLKDLGGRCLRCGFTDTRALQIDHVNGNGRKDRKLGNSSYSYFRRIRLNPSEYQILCANCNWIKRFENNEHGVQKVTAD
jgi:hypothetical protein